MSRPDHRPNRDAGTFLALAILLLIAGGMLFLMAMVMPDVVLALFVPLGLFAVGILHWLVWGRWLTKRLPRDPDDSTG